ELEILAVGDFVSVDGKGRHCNGVRFVLVVPAKQGGLTALQTQRRAAFRNLDHAWLNRTHHQLRQARLPYLVAEGQLVQHVRQRFRMHQSVFDSYVKQLVPGLSGTVIQRHSSQSIIEGAADLTYILT